MATDVRYFAIAGAAAAILGALAPDAMAAAPTTPLTTMNNPAAAVAKARVENTQGQTIGSVVSVVTGADGHALVVTVDAGAVLGGHKIVGIQASSLGFDPARHVLVASLTPAQVEALPTLS